MTWLRNVWYRLWTWVASWGRQVEPPKPRFDDDAQDLIFLARKIKRERWNAIPDPAQTNHITPEAYRQMMQQAQADEPQPPAKIYRSASFTAIQQQLKQDVEALQPEREPLTLKVQK